MSDTYTWKVESVNHETHHMEVAFTFDGKTTILNLPIPENGVDLAGWIDDYAPRTQWVPRTANTEIAVGAAGVSPANLEDVNSEGASEMPSVVGNWQEEYLRAMIYTVLEEIREAEV